jgi:hypothetical protein
LFNFLVSDDGRLTQPINNIYNISGELFNGIQFLFTGMNEDIRVEQRRCNHFFSVRPLPVYPVEWTIILNISF